MKLFLTTLLFPFIITTASAQCADYTADREGTIKINIYSETGECFKVDLRGSSMTPSSTSNFTFMVNASAKVKVILDNGNVIEKNILLNEDIVSAFFAIKVNKKGKWSLKNKLGKMEKTPESIQAWDDKLAADKAEMDAKQAKSDAEWDAARQAEKDERAAEKAKEDAEDDKKSAQRDADREARYAEQRKSEDAARPKNDLEERKAAEEAKRKEDLAKREKEKAKSQEDLKASRATTTTTTSSSPSSTTTTTTTSSKPASTGSTSVPMMVTYKGAPVTDTYITLEIEGVVIGSSTTDNSGKAIIKTNKPVNTEVPYKLSGKKGSAKWSFGGVLLLERDSKETKVPLEYVVRVMAEEMGVSESVIANSWGL